jgi:hypothetical protein
MACWDFCCLHNISPRMRRSGHVTRICEISLISSNCRMPRKLSKEKKSQLGKLALRQPYFADASESLYFYVEKRAHSLPLLKTVLIIH